MKSSGLRVQPKGQVAYKYKCRAIAMRFEVVSGCSRGVTLLKGIEAHSADESAQSAEKMFCLHF